ncbi:MAG: aminotransferase class V-fold PLP-dependent enzyme [Planctomycetes bacterium]|nr:aminotransferase class V-fold PLP-dependent enzyme [Planctomycetota bacterium]
MMTTIYLDNNATTRIAPEVAEAMWPWLTEHYGNPSSLHRFGEDALEAVSRARASVARLLGARHASEIVFTAGGTESNHLALHQARGAAPERKRVITTAVEHPAVLEPSARLADSGFVVERARVEHDGSLALDAFLASLDTRCALVSVMWANNETGAIHDVAAIGRRCRELGILFHVDAVQAAGKLAFVLTDLAVDYVSVSAHKLHGPQGVGALWVRRGSPFDAWTRGGSQEADRRAGTENVAGIVGFGRAAELAREWLAGGGPERLAALRDELERRLRERIDGFEVAAAKIARTSGTSQFVFGDVSGEALVLALSDAGVCASSGSACSSGTQAPSHVLTAMGWDAAHASSSLRLSLSRFTTEDEVARATELVASAVRDLRSLLGSPRS